MPAVLAGLVHAQARLFREATCETYDEFTYLRLGIRVFRYGDFTSLSSPMAPPLPILLEYGWPSLRAWALPEGEAWERQVPGLIRQARTLTSVLLGIPLAWLVHAWLARRRGPFAGAVGGGLVALSPSVIAAASVAGTDACFALFGLLALTALRYHQARPSSWTFVAAGVAMGLALASKQTAVVLAPVAAVELLLRSPRRMPGMTRVDACLWALFLLGWRLSALIALAFLVDWAVYGFGLAPAFGSGGAHVGLPIVVQMMADGFPDSEAIMRVARRLGPPLAIDTFVGQVEHATQGHAAFLMGRRSYHGWWYFFPVTLALKSTPAEWLLFLGASWTACRPASWVDPTRRLWLVSAVSMMALGIFSSLNIGHRYMLLLYPLVILIAVDALGAWRLRMRRRLWGTVAGVLLLAWQAVSAAGVAPHYLGYFNSMCGGPSQGYRYLVDSNLDWGQDLPLLRRALEARSYRRVALAYFGTARPWVYGIRSEDWLSFDDPRAPCDWLAISATVLQGVYNGPADLIDRFGPLPAVRVGYSLFLYDLKDPRVRGVLEGVRRDLRRGGSLPGANQGPLPSNREGSGRGNRVGGA